MIRQFKTKVEYYHFGGERLSVYSPRTGACIHLDKSQIDNMPDELYQHIFTTIAKYIQNMRCNTQLFRQLTATAYLQQHPCQVMLSAEDLAELYRLSLIETEEAQP